MLYALAGAGVLAALWIGMGSRQSADSAPGAATAEPSATDGPCAAGRAWHVAPDGVAGNDGAVERPMDLATALSAGSPVRPCDTIWLRGGTYRGQFVSSIRGQEGAPIMVRATPGERATIDSAPSGKSALHVIGDWIWFWDLEITNSDPRRSSKEAVAWPGDLSRGAGVTTKGSHLRFIDLIVHDMTRGFEVGSESIDTEVYGSLIYANGWEGPNGAANGHGIDTHNRVGRRRLADNLIFNQFSHGVIAYSSTTDPTNNMTLEGNIFFNNGALSRGGAERDLLIGGGSIVENPILTDNVMYGRAPSLVGMGAGCTSGSITNNYFATPFQLAKCDPELRGNTFLVSEPMFATAHPQNTFERGRPRGVVVRVRPNQYVRGRAHVAVLNWDRQPSVDVDLSASGLRDGEPFELRDAQDFFGAPLLKGTYAAGRPVSVPATARPPAAPIGAVPTVPQSTAPEFLPLVVLPASSAQPGRTAN
ncbi:MAG: hypothetical protein IT184_09395 [Acidobacteria bacterium]|nr:hypothetical protein [Acidobacteriota bacterium]